MDNETKKVFELLIDKIDSLSEKQDCMGARLDKIEIRLDSMDARLDKMETRLDNMDVRLDKIEIRLDSMETRQDEIFSIVKAIEHSNATHKAEIDNMTHKLAHTEGIFNKIGNVIVESRAVN